MKILLFGEYNRFHKFLKEGLQALGHEAIVVGRKDTFKKVDVDVSLEIKYFNLPVFYQFRRLGMILLNFDIADVEVYFNYLKFKKNLKGYDIVQLVNEFPLHINPNLEKKALAFIFKNNTNVFLSACGDDCVYVDYLLNSNLDYHLLQPYLKNKKLKKQYAFNLQFLKKSKRRLHHFIIQNIKAVIPSDFDYLMAYRGHKKALPLIPYAINLSNFEYKKPVVNNQIIIFHGINRINYYRKGNNYFEEALKIIASKYGNRVKIIMAENRPYKEYIALFDEAHILLDQVYAYDQGYNALEAMAKGKVVFTGAEKEWLAHYDVAEDTVCINTLPDVSYLVKKLEWLIQNPEKIIEISKNARVFVEKEHDHINIAKRYIKHWTSASN